jgi:hypothetical protein
MEESIMHIFNEKYPFHRFYDAFSPTCTRMRKGWLAMILAIALVLGFNAPAIAANPAGSVEQNRASAIC